VGIQRYGDVFFAWGEDRSAGAGYTGVACYTSRDLATWTFEGYSLSRDENVADLAAGRVVERPKVLRNPSTGQYVMFLHIDSPDYADARVGWAIADNAVGPYRYLRNERPFGNLSRDIGVFQDDDGSGYLLSEDRDHGLHIYRLAEDYLSVAALVATTTVNAGGHGYESPALVKADGLYYLFGSDLTGWSTNDNKVATASSLAGPWSAWQDFAPPGSATFDSQISTIVTVAGSRATTYVYVGDRWDSGDLFSSAPVWLPIRIGAGRAQLHWCESWTIDVTTGTMTGTVV